MRVAPRRLLLCLVLVIRPISVAGALSAVSTYSSYLFLYYTAADAMVS